MRPCISDLAPRSSGHSPTPKWQLRSTYLGAIQYDHYLEFHTALEQ